MRSVVARAARDRWASMPSRAFNAIKPARSVLRTASELSAQRRAFCDAPKAAKGVSHDRLLARGCSHLGSRRVGSRAGVSLQALVDSTDFPAQTREFLADVGETKGTPVPAFSLPSRRGQCDDF